MMKKIKGEDKSYKHSRKQGNVCALKVVLSYLSLKMIHNYYIINVKKTTMQKTNSE